MTDFHSQLDADGVATITWDVPGKSMNVMSLEGIDELRGLFEIALADDAVKGIVLTSGKDSFAGGMDLDAITRMKDMTPDNPAEGLFKSLMQAHDFMRKIETSGRDPKTLKGGKPVAAALPGTAMGIGVELPLACHRIFAADKDEARIGLPEIKLGLFPGAGGTTRLSRKLGLMAAAPILLEGRTYTPKKAVQAGLVDEVVPSDELIERAKAWVLNATDDDLIKPWDKKGWKMPGGAPYHPAGFMTFVGASAMVGNRTKGVYPAAKALLASIYEGAQVSFETALRIEARWFTSILADPSSAAMIRTLFLSKQALEKGVARPAQAKQDVQKLGVVGAGMMGAGIAQVAAAAGIDVALIDQTDAAAQAGLARIDETLSKSVSRRRLSEEQKSRQMARIAPSADYASLADCDLVVEAVFEDPKVKAETTRKAEKYLD
ncbi:MAG: enoyl-CoA hydratase-related protein, partial [Pseudomonadota bacterium]